MKAAPVAAAQPNPGRAFASGRDGGKAGLCLVVSIAVLTLLSAIQPTLAQTIVPDGTNLNNLAAPTSSTIWNLQGNAVLSNGTSAAFAKALPAGTPGLTINASAGGSTITMGDGAGHFGFFSGGASTLNLTDVSIVGGSEVTGGAISLTGALTVNGNLAVNNNIATNGNGGAIAVSTGGVTVTVASSPIATQAAQCLPIPQ